MIELNVNNELLEIEDSGFGKEIIEKLLSIKFFYKSITVVDFKITIADENPVKAYITGNDKKRIIKFNEPISFTDLIDILEEELVNNDGKWFYFDCTLLKKF